MRVKCTDLCMDGTVAPWTINPIFQWSYSSAASFRCTCILIFTLKFLRKMLIPTQHWFIINSLLNKFNRPTCWQIEPGSWYITCTSGTAQAILIGLGKCIWTLGILLQFAFHLKYCLECVLKIKLDGNNYNGCTCGSHIAGPGNTCFTKWCFLSLALVSTWTF